MKRKLLAFSMTLAMLLSVLSIASAHTVKIEGTGTTEAPSITEWFGLPPDTPGEGIIQRNNAQQGEYIFNDAGHDQRLITSSTKDITRSTDLDWFGITADQNNIYFVAKPDYYRGITQDPAIELMISIDTDHASSPDPSKFALPNNAGISVASDAAWEYVIDAAYTKGNQASNGVVTTVPKIYTHINAADPVTLASCSAAPLPSLEKCGAQLVSGKSFAEISVPWSQIGGKPADTDFYLRFSVAVFYNPRTQPTDGSASTAVIDFLNAGKTMDATDADIADGQLGLDTSFDVHFDSNGPAPTYEPYAPLLVTEFQANPPGKDDPACIGQTTPCTDSEWIELYNPNSFPIPLSKYKVGNAAKRDPASSQGMFQFKATSIPAKGQPGNPVIVARSRSKFLAAHPGFNTTVSPVYDLSANMTQYGAWSGGSTIDLANGPSSGQTVFEEQIVLLDAKDGIVDMVNYGNKIPHYPGNVPIATNNVPDPTSVDDSVSWERCSANVDTNGGYVDKLNEAVTNADFVIHNSASNKETPGVICQGRPGVDMMISKNGPGVVVPNGDVTFTLTYANIGSSDELPGAQATITDTLPAGLSFTNAPENVSVTPFSVSPDGKTIVWKVAAPAHGGQPSTITLKTTVDSGVLGNTPLVNTAKISSPNEPTNAQQLGVRDNNESPWTVTTLGPAKLNLSFGGLASTPPGSQFSFTIDYYNSGQTDASDTAISLSIPGNVKLLSVTSLDATPNFNTPIDGATTVTWSQAVLATNQHSTITVVGQVLSSVTGGTALPFSATISSPDGEPVTKEGTLTAQFNKIYLPFIRK